MNQKKDAVQAVYNWQYIHSLGQYIRLKNYKHIVLLCYTVFNVYFTSYMYDYDMKRKGEGSSVTVH